MRRQSARERSGANPLTAINTARFSSESSTNGSVMMKTSVDPFLIVNSKSTVGTKAFWRTSEERSANVRGSESQRVRRREPRRSSSIPTMIDTNSASLYVPSLYISSSNSAPRQPTALFANGFINV